MQRLLQVLLCTNGTTRDNQFRSLPAKPLQNHEQHNQVQHANASCCEDSKPATGPYKRREQYKPYKPHSMPFSRAASCNSIKEHAHLIFSPAKEQSTIKSTHSQEAAQPATSVYQANRDHLIHVCERGKISASPWSRLRLRHYDPRHHFADPENDMKGWIKPQCIGWCKTGNC